MSSFPSLRPGARLGAYEIIAELGAGGMGVVFAGRQVALEKPVAIKVLRADASSHETARARFAREGRAAARLRHPHVVDVFDVGEQDGVAYLVMELLEGVDLAELLRQRGTLPVEEIAALLLPVLAAIAAAHDAGVIHRDIKPSNIFIAIDKHGTTDPKVLDFGISKLDAEPADASLTDTEARLGTLRFMSPEHARSAKNVDARSDQYSLGVVLYECATGQPAFAGPSSYDLMHAIVTSAFASPRSLRPDLPQAFEDIILRAMRGHADFRYPSVRAMGRDLLRFAAPVVRARWERELGQQLAAPPPMVTRDATGNTTQGLDDASAGDGSVADRAVVSTRRRTLSGAGERASWGLPAALVGACVALVGAFVALRGPASADRPNPFEEPTRSVVAPPAPLASVAAAPLASVAAAPLASVAAALVEPAGPRAAEPVAATRVTRAAFPHASQDAGAPRLPRASASAKAPLPTVDHGPNNAAILE